MNKDLLPEELIWLMDELSTREVCNQTFVHSFD